MKLTKAQKAARGKDCVVLIPGTCCHDPATVVLAHLGSGTAKRRYDSNAAYACVKCHDAIDRRSWRFMSHDDAEQNRLNDEREAFIEAAKDRMKALREKAA